MFALSADGCIASWNAGAEATFGYAEAEVLGKDYAMLFTAEDVEAARPAAELVAAAAKGCTSVDGWHRRKDGTRFWCTDTLQPSYDFGGALAGFTKIVRDSTDRYVASERLRESEERLRLLIEGVTDYAIFAIDLDGKITFWNSGAERIFGHREADAVGRHFSLVYTVEAIARGVPLAEFATADVEGRISREGWYARRNGHLFYASVHATRLGPDPSGRPRGFVMIAHDITARNDADEAMRLRAFRDDLTQLPNRAYFIDRLRAAIERAKLDTARRFAVLFIDLDRFKVINDSLGHVIADDLLVHVARTLGRCVRPSDTVARLGGDEFTILLAEVHDASEATSVAARIHAALRVPLHINGFEVVTTASIGIAVGPADYDAAEQIVRDADIAMYEAKARGRACDVLFDAEMRARAVTLLRLQADLRRAIERDEFFIEYQPIVSLERSTAVGFEALVRWRHPERGILLPASFISEAENMGLVVRIDLWVLREACRRLRGWQVRFRDDALVVSVNVASATFDHESLIPSLRAMLADNDLSPQSLKLEIAEGALEHRFDAASATARDVRDLGIELFVDDYGAGCSSLRELAGLPIALLKIERSFVGGMTADPRSSAVARTIVALAHNLGIASLAEGVENAAQRDRLRDFGCEFAQGEYFSSPVSAEAAAECIGRSIPTATK